jgi:hypothetical protein
MFIPIKQPILYARYINDVFSGILPFEDEDL